MSRCRHPIIDAESARWAIEVVEHQTRRMLFMAASHVAENPFHIHYPTESSLIYDGIRKTVALCVRLASDLNQTGWRQAEHLTKQIKKIVRNISKIAARKSPKAKASLPTAYENLLNRANVILKHC